MDASASTQFMCSCGHATSESGHIGHRGNGKYIILKRLADFEPGSDGPPHLKCLSCFLKFADDKWNGNCPFPSCETTIDKRTAMFLAPMYYKTEQQKRDGRKLKEDARASIKGSKDAAHLAVTGHPRPKNDKGVGEEEIPSTGKQKGASSTTDPQSSPRTTLRKPEITQAKPLNDPTKIPRPNATRLRFPDIYDTLNDGIPGSSPKWPTGKLVLVAAIVVGVVLFGFLRFKQKAKV